MRDLGTLGGSWSKAVAINNRGQIVGTAIPGLEIRTGMPSSTRFLWETGRMRDLGTLSGSSSEAVAINDRGQVVGNSDTRRQTKYNRPIRHSLFWQNGTIRDLGTLDGKSSGAWTGHGSDAVATNQRGQMVGSSEKKAGEHMFMWQNRKMHDLGRGSAMDLNTTGQIVGRPHAFLRRGGKITDLGVLPGDICTKAEAINDRGEIIGYSYRELDNHGDAAMRSLSSGRPGLGTLGGKQSYPTAINQRGQVVGWSDTTHDTRAFVWQNGALTDLGTLASRADSGALAINEHAR
jgi:probable HAF family extracellular repeat protein